MTGRSRLLDTRPGDGSVLFNDARSSHKKQGRLRMRSMAQICRKIRGRGQGQINQAI